MQTNTRFLEIQSFDLIGKYTTRNRSKLKATTLYADVMLPQERMVLDNLQFHVPILKSKYLPRTYRQSPQRKDVSETARIRRNMVDDCVRMFGLSPTAKIKELAIVPTLTKTNTRTRSMVLSTYRA